MGEAAWTELSPCSDFARNAWFWGSGEHLDKGLFINTPDDVADGIEKANGNGRHGMKGWYPAEKPPPKFPLKPDPRWQSDGANDGSSSSSSSSCGYNQCQDYSWLGPLAPLFEMIASQGATPGLLL